MTPFSIWLVALLLYGIFWSWYVGFRRRITPAEVDEVLDLIASKGDVTEAQLSHLRRFFERDDGRDFVMVNLLDLKRPARESRKKLDHYQKIFLGNLLKRAGHPILIANAASGNIENVACDDVDNWMAAGLIRYRSRRDLMEVLPDTVGSEHHNLKLESLERTFAFPAAPWMVMGGPRWIVALALALTAALLHIILF